jgi:hypothetical protein
MGDPMQPARQGVTLLQARELPGKQEKGCLKGVLTVLGMLQDPPADAVHHGSVAAHQCLKGSLVRTGKQTFNQSDVGLLGQPLCGYSAHQAVEEAVHPRCWHLGLP